MPGINIYKDYLPESYYHVYNRGVNKRTIFKDNADYVVFLGLLKRYLGEGTSANRNGVVFPSYKGKIELLAFCLMPNHFHLLIYQHHKDAMMMFMKSLGVAYSMYFNKKNKRTGPLFGQRYKASRITRNEYLLHISRYIHLNPKNYQSWEFSSLHYYLGDKQASWMSPERIMELFDGGTNEYRQFLADYEDYKEATREIKSELADR